ncbi:DedA family protein [Marinomonas sp. PE14-40]|uniref:DedA family protein n=1 Tax=Marinomonas sp. PE14-40 TaxID=3060621 RepID=UPI003F6776A9
MIEMLINWTQNPALLFIGIILMSYLLEDAAIISAALLGVEGSLSYTAGLISIFIGIASGDLILYYLGKSSHKVQWAKKRLESKTGIEISKRLQRTAFWSIFIIRFIPGLRSISYLACGALKVDLRVFFLSVMSATALWCIFIYSAIFFIGDALWLTDSAWRWALAPVLLLIIYFANRQVSQAITKEPSV